MPDQKCSFCFSPIHSSNLKGLSDHNQNLPKSTSRYAGLVDFISQNLIIKIAPFKQPDFNMELFNENITLPLSDVIATFDSVGGVIYTYSENDDILLMPYNTMAKCWVTECDVLDANTREVIDTNRLIPTEHLYEAVDKMF